MDLVKTLTLKNARSLALTKTVSPPEEHSLSLYIHIYISVSFTQEHYLLLSLSLSKELSLFLFLFFSLSFYICLFICQFPSRKNTNGHRSQERSRQSLSKELGSFTLKNTHDPHSQEHTLNDVTRSFVESHKATVVSKLLGPLLTS